MSFKKNKNQKTPRFYMYLCKIKNRRDPTLKGPIYSTNSRKVWRIEWNGYDTLTVKACTITEADKIIKSFISTQKEVDISILPIPVDFQVLRGMLWNIRTGIKVTYHSRVLFFGRKGLRLNTKRLKSELNRTIQQNDKWTRNLRQLEKEVNEYIKKPSENKEQKIWQDMFELHFSPENFAT